MPRTNRFQNRRPGIAEDSSEPAAEPEAKASPPTKKSAAKTGKAPRKTKTKKEEVDVYSAEFRSSLMQNLELRNQEYNGSIRCVRGDDLDRLFIGIPIPLAVQLMIGLTSLPLSAFYQVFGLEETCKSAFAMEILHWFLKFGGVGRYVENEGKFSPSLWKSMLGPLTSFAGVTRSQSVEEWQRAVLHNMRALTKELEGDGKKIKHGKIIPACFVIDSLTAKLTAGNQFKIAKEGSAGPGHPQEAGSITRFFQTVPRFIDENPFILVGISHDKPTKDPRINVVQHNTQGGMHIRFQSSLRLLITHSQGNSWILRTKTLEGREISLQTYKNSLSGQRRKIQTRLWWKVEKDEDTGKARQKTWWDWHWSLINVLHNLEGEERESVKKFLKYDTNTGAGYGWPGKFVSPTLGIPKNEPISWSKAGALISENDELVSQLQAALKVLPYNVFERGKDYQEQRGERAEFLRRKRKAKEDKERDDAAGCE